MNPQTDRAAAIVEQYGGMYSFSQQQNQFVLRISL